MKASSSEMLLDVCDAPEAATCEEHGVYQARLVTVCDGKPIRARCPQCVDAARQRELDRAADARQLGGLARTRALFDSSGMPPRFHDRTFENFIAVTSSQKRVLEATTGFPARSMTIPGLSMILTGRCGTGKNHLAAACAQKFTASGRSVLFKTTLQLVRYVKSTYNRGSEKTEAQAYADLLRPDLLIVDEVGIALGTDHEKTVLWEVLNDRYSHLRSTILLSNLTRAELTSFLGERLMDRYNECGAILAFDWGSHRGAAIDE